MSAAAQDRVVLSAMEGGPLPSAVGYAGYRWSPGVYYVRLEVIRRLGSGAYPWYPGAQVATTLKTGQTYRIRAVGARQGKPEDAVSFVAPMEFRLVLRAGTLLKRTSPVSVRPEEVGRSLKGYFHEFRLPVPPEWPTRGDAVLELWYRIAGSGHDLQVVASQPVAIEGNHFDVDEGFLAGAYVDYLGRTPANVAVLHIEVLKTGELRLSGQSPCAGPLAPLVVPRPQTDLSALAGVMVEGRRVAPSAILNRMTRESRRLPPELWDWLYRLAAEPAADDVYLIIVDEDLELPWELLLTLDERCELGTKIQISRWTDIRSWGSERLRVAERVCAGDTLAYLVSDLSGTDNEWGVLDGWAERCETMGALGKRLAESGTLALVFLACHGAFASSEEHGQLIDEAISLGRLSDPGGRWALLDLEGMPLVPVEERRLIVLANACHSARVFRDKRGQLLGLPEAMLARFAGGYIGTLEAVGSEHAANVAQFVLGKAQSLKSARPAGILRLLREREMQEWKKARSGPDGEDKEEKALALLYSTMYTYYGNPLIRFDLSPRAPRERQETQAGAGAP